MKNKVILVTGATGNLGNAVAKNFLAQGYTVIGTTTSSTPGKRGIEHTNFETVAVDLTNEESTQACIKKIIHDHQRIDAAVLTAGGFATGTIAKTSAADILKQYKLNFETAYNAAKPVFEQMILQKQGRIFLIGSKPGLDAKYSSGMVGYSLAKALLFRLADMMNDEAKGVNVVTSVIIPSTINTPQNREAMPGADASKWVTPEAIADVISFYCSEQASALREPVIKVYNNA